MPPQPPQHHSYVISPELALVDRAIADSIRDQRGIAPNRLRVVEPESSAALQRLCALSDVNPARRGRPRIALSGVVALWAEAVILVAAQTPIGALQGF